MKKVIFAVLLSFTTIFMSACGGGGSDSAPATTTDTTAPIFSTSSTISIKENQISAIDVNATDETSSVIYSISDGDSTDFDVNASTGVISFKVAPDYETKQSYSFTVSAKDNSNNTNTQNMVITILDEDIVHNTTHYESVVSPYTGKVWLDRNLGASQVCSALDDATCYGSHYQFGRNYDGHQEASSAITSTLYNAIDGIGSDFVARSSSPYDWTTADSNGSLRVSNWSKTDGTSICPVGFRVPTMLELRYETLNASQPITNNIDAFNSFLKLPSAGTRYKTDGSIESEGVAGSIATTKLTNTDAHYIVFASTIAAESNEDFTFAHSIRCIADEVNHAPTWTASSYATGLTITDASDAEQIIKDLTAVSSDADGGAITYSVVSISVPNSVEQTSWNNSVVINSGVLQVQNLMTNDPDVNGVVTVTVKATSTGGSSDTTVSFTFNDVQ